MYFWREKILYVSKFFEVFFLAWQKYSAHDGHEFGYKSWKFQILPILSAMQGPVDPPSGSNTNTMGNILNHWLPGLQMQIKM